MGDLDSSCIVCLRKLSGMSVVLVVWGIEPRTLPMLGKCSTIERYLEQCLLYSVIRSLPPVHLNRIIRPRLKYERVLGKVA